MSEFDQERIDRLKKPGPVREIMEATESNGYPPYVWFDVENILKKYSASSSQGLTFRWEGDEDEKEVYIGSFATGIIMLCVGDNHRGDEESHWTICGPNQREFETLCLPESEAKKTGDKYAKHLIAKLEGRE